MNSGGSASPPPSRSVSSGSLAKGAATPARDQRLLSSFEGLLQEEVDYVRHLNFVLKVRVRPCVRVSMRRRAACDSISTYLARLLISHGNFACLRGTVSRRLGVARSACAVLLSTTSQGLQWRAQALALGAPGHVPEPARNPRPPQGLRLEPQATTAALSRPSLVGLYRRTRAADSIFCM